MLLPAAPERVPKIRRGSSHSDGGGDGLLVACEANGEARETHPRA